MEEVSMAGVVIMDGGNGLMGAYQWRRGLQLFGGGFLGHSG